MIECRYRDFVLKEKSGREKKRKKKKKKKKKKSANHMTNKTIGHCDYIIFLISANHRMNKTIGHLVEIRIPSRQSAIFPNATWGNPQTLNYP
jgi:hypothetical protein